MGVFPSQGRFHPIFPQERSAIVYSIIVGSKTQCERGRVASSSIQKIPQAEKIATSVPRARWRFALLGPAQKMGLREAEFLTTATRSYWQNARSFLFPLDENKIHQHGRQCRYWRIQCAQPVHPHPEVASVPSSTYPGERFHLPE